jgi:glycerol-3-phosphate acyltransferase PlsX
MNTVHLAVDAMGGDHAPGEIVAGAVNGARELGIKISLVGDPHAIKAELEKASPSGLQVDLIPASDVIHFNENPVKAVRSKPGASINVACRLVADGFADGVLTMGHTGAGLVSAKRFFGSIQGVDRPAPIVPLLDLRKDLYLIDAGANTEVKPHNLLQFARMGSVYAQYTGGIKQPRIGLLSIGSEPNKGSRIVREAFSLLEAAADINFSGNIEGHSMLDSDVNVLVCDGFVGNVLFKTIEGVLDSLLSQVEAILPKIPNFPSSLLKNHLENLRTKNDYAAIGAAALLGLQRPLFIGHGRSKAIAVRNGLATAKRMITSNVLNALRNRMEAYI